MNVKKEKRKKKSELQLSLLLKGSKFESGLTLTLAWLELSSDE